MGFPERVRKSGYTHYWSVNRDADREAVKQAGLKMARLVEAESEILAGWDGEGEPTLDPETGEARFNGRGPDLDHETFVWPPNLDEPQLWRGEDDGTVFTFCKTARKPYDKVVVACLLVAQRELGDAIKISSDASDLFEFMGGDVSEGWQKVNSMLGHPTDAYEGTAHELYVRVFGEEPPIPPSFAREADVDAEEADAAA